MKRRRLSRRAFLGNAGRTALGAVAFPYVITSTALGSGSTPPASQRITLGHIGVGGQGSGLLTGFLGVDGCQSIAVCDAFKSRREQRAKEIDAHFADLKGKAEYKACAAYEDFRELLSRPDIDAVVVATPDHWHVLIGLAAARSGKDMYVEKPLGLSIDQDKALRSAVQRYGRIFQYGTQQRSFNTHCAFACELVRNGYLGKIKETHVEAPAGNSGGSTDPVPVPEGFNYTLWLGPAPVSPYTMDRCTSSGSWYVYDNSLGFIAGWGAHPLDILHWGYEQIPVEYEGTGTIPTKGLFTAITNWDIRGRFANGVPFTFKDGPDKTTFVGENGWVAASRAGIEAEPKALLSTRIKPGEIRLLQATNHYQNFIDAVKTRRPPASPIESAVQSDFVSHLCDIAIRTGRKIQWDPVKEEIVGDSIASRMMARPMRAPWGL
jgi:glucose-fructose oxidoreductase